MQNSDYKYFEDAGLDPSVFSTVEKVLRERGNIHLDDLSEAQRREFLVRIAAGLCERAARERAIGASIEVSRGGN